jgi:hypothetical protein
MVERRQAVGVEHALEQPAQMGFDQLKLIKREELQFGSTFYPDPRRVILGAG